MITLAEAKAHLRVEHTADDALITSLIGAAYRHAEKCTGVVFDQESRTFVFDGFPAGRQPVKFPVAPVQSVTTVAYTDPDDAAQTLTGTVLDTRPALPRLLPAWEDDWPDTTEAPQSVTITATVGYATTPDDVRAALLLLIGHWYENRESVVIGTISSEVPMGVEMLLGPHTIHRVG